MNWNDNGFFHQHNFNTFGVPCQPLPQSWSIVQMRTCSCAHERHWVDISTVHYSASWHLGEVLEVVEGGSDLVMHSCFGRHRAGALMVVLPSDMQAWIVQCQPSGTVRTKTSCGHGRRWALSFRLSVSWRQDWPIFHSTTPCQLAATLIHSMQRGNSLRPHSWSSGAVMLDKGMQ